jgi:hypothetical protein
MILLPSPPLLCLCVSPVATPGGADSATSAPHPPPATGTRQVRPAPSLSFLSGTSPNPSISYLYSGLAESQVLTCIMLLTSNFPHFFRKNYRVCPCQTLSLPQLSLLSVSSSLPISPDRLLVRDGKYSNSLFCGAFMVVYAKVGWSFCGSSVLVILKRSNVAVVLDICWGTIFQFF